MSCAGVGARAACLTSGPRCRVLSKLHNITTIVIVVFRLFRTRTNNDRLARVVGRNCLTISFFFVLSNFIVNCTCSSH